MFNAILHLIFEGGPDTTLLQGCHRGLVCRQQLYLPQSEELPRVQVVDLLVVVFVFFFGAQMKISCILYDAFEL